jgi:restriction system protein
VVVLRVIEIGRFMARKKKQSPFEDLIEITAMLPWWAGVLLALIAYIVCHHYATAEVAQTMKLGQLGGFVVSQFGKTFATFGQYLLPLAFLIGAGISAYGRHKRATLFEDVQENSSLSALNGMPWQEFEMLVSGNVPICRPKKLST